MKFSHNRLPKSCILSDRAITTWSAPLASFCHFGGFKKIIILYIFFLIWLLSIRNMWLNGFSWSYGEGNDTPLQYSCLEDPMGRGAWWAAVHGVVKSQTQLSDFTFTFHFHALEKEMATHSSVLAWRIPRTEEPGRLPSMGSHRVGHNWNDLAAAADPRRADVSVRAQRQEKETQQLSRKSSLSLRLFVLFKSSAD